MHEMLKSNPERIEKYGFVKAKKYYNLKFLEIHNAEKKIYNSLRDKLRRVCNNIEKLECEVIFQITGESTCSSYVEN